MDVKGIKKGDLVFGLQDINKVRSLRFSLFPLCLYKPINSSILPGIVSTLALLSVQHAQRTDRRRP